MTIVPDGKDWTWVLQRRCGQCGFDTAGFARERVGGLLRSNAAAWQPVLAGGSVGTRPAPDTWSALEYACHVRDVFGHFDERLTLMRVQDDPLFPNWDQDATAVEERYAEQDPATIAVDLYGAAERLAARFEDVSEAEWSRPGRRSDGAAFTIETLARYLIHDPVHHLWDVTGVPAPPAGPGSDPAS